MLIVALFSIVTSYKGTGTTTYTHLDEGVSDDLSFLLGVGGHVEGLADAFPGCAILLRDGQRRRAVVERVRCVYDCAEKGDS